MFVVTAYSGGNLKHVETAKATLRDLTPTGNKQALCDMRLSGHGTNTALILCALVRNEGHGAKTWSVKEIGVPCEG